VKSDEKGFTLIEMLIAMAIFAALIMVLMSGYRQGLMMWDKGQHMSRQWLALEFRYRLLDTLFAQAIVADDEFAAGYTAPCFSGGGATLMLLTAAPLMDHVGHVRPVRLQLVHRPGGTLSLRYQEGELYSDQKRGIRWGNQWIVLLKGLRQASFSYEAPANPLPEVLSKMNLGKQAMHRYRNQAEWLPSFQSHEMLLYPRRVALRFTDANDNRQRWLFRPPDISEAWIMVGDY